MNAKEVYKDVTSLSDCELDKHIQRLRCASKDGQKSVNDVKLKELLHALLIAIAEKNNRSSHCIAKAALIIGGAGVFVALIGVFR